MHPPADVEPAIVSMMEQLSSFSMVLNISAALARSRDVNDMLPMLSMIGRASKDAMSICSISRFSRSALRPEVCFISPAPLRSGEGGRNQAPVCGAGELALFREGIAERRHERRQVATAATCLPVGIHAASP